MNSPGSRRIFWMVRLLTAVSLITIILLVGMVGRQISSIRAERVKLQKEQDRLYQASEELLRLSTEARGEIIAILDDNALTRKSGATKSLAETVDRLRITDGDSFAPDALRQLDGLTDQLVEVEHRAVTWRVHYDAVWQDLDQQRTIGLARDLTTGLRGAVQTLEGKHRMEEAIQFKHWRAAKGEGAAHLAQAILASESSKLHRTTDDLETDLAEIENLIELLGGEEHPDNLPNLKDNKLVPALERLNHDLDQLTEAQPDGSALTKQTTEQLTATLLGQDYATDQAYSPGPGLYSLRRDILILRSEREKLNKERWTLTHDIDALVADFMQSIQVQSESLTEQAERNLASSWRRMLIGGIGCSALFVWLAWLISRAIRGQVGVIERAKAEAESGRQTAQRLMRDIQKLQHDHELVLNAIGEGIHRIDCDGQIIFENPAGRRLLGWEASELVGRSAHATMHHTRKDGSIFPQDECPIHQSLRTGVSLRVDNEVFWRKDGTSFPVEYTAAPVRDEKEKIIGAVVVFTDITQRQQSEKALTQSEARYRSLFEANPFPMWVYDLESLFFLEVNDAAVSHYGYGREEFLSMTIADIRPPADKPRLLASVAEIVAGDAVINAGLWKHRKMDGSIIDVEITSHVLDYGGRQAELVLASDITERKRVEAEREVMSEIATGIVTTSDLDEFLRLAHHSIGKLIYAESCFVALHNPATGLMHFEFWIDQVDPVPAPQPVGKGLSASSYVLRTGQPLLLTSEIKTRLSEQGEIQVIGSDSPSWLGVPLRTSTGILGVLAVQHYAKENVYSARDLEFLRGVGDQVALAIERKRAEVALRESQTQLELAMKASNIGPWDWNLTTNKVFFSPEWKRQLGFAEDEITSDFTEFFSRLHPDDLQPVTLAVENCIAGSESGYEIEFRLRHKDGTYRWIHTRGVLHFDAAGRPIRMLGCHVDITDRRRTEEELREAKVAAALRESDQRYSFLADTVPLIIWTAQPDGCVDYYNKAWFDYTGLTLDETKDWGWEAVLHPDDLQACIAQWTHCFTTGENYDIEYRFKRASDGAYRWHLGRAMPMRDEQGQIMHWVGTCTDIDDAKRSKETLQAANDELGLRVIERTADLYAAKELAEAASRAKSEFLANMSHEIRTPMNGIIGMTELALETGLDRTQREYLDMVRSSALALLTLINDILDFSKIEADKMELESIDFNFRECIGGLLKPLGLRADQKDLELVAEIAADVPNDLVGDPMRLRQILINLTDNAIKFTERGEVVLKVITEVTPEGDTQLHFSISDTGIGIPPEKQDAIFQAFAQADGSTTRTHGGTGLGLSIASQLIKKMRGRIWVESKVGEGTTFHFTARLGLSAKPSPLPNHNQRDLAGLRVLVVDDNAINRRMLHDVLVNWEMKPTVVASGASAMDEMRMAANANAPYQLVLLDAMMPGMDGFALAEKIQGQRTLAGATVMMLSSAMFGGIAERCDAVGITGWLTKPITQSDLLEAILRAIGAGDNLHAGQPVPSEAQPLPPSLRILVAEDNVINRAVASGILEKQGHSLVHASNGLEVLSALETGTFDLIFMDVQMPEMDGFQATGRIRELETASGAHVPIIAMTAHAMDGDRERCLAAGMDDYISKPVRKEDVLRVLEEFREGPTARVVGAASAEPVRLEPRRSVYTRKELLAQCDGDGELMGRLIGLFQENTPRLLDNIRVSIASRGSAQLARSAHALLSSLGAFGAMEAHRLTRQLETQALEESFEQSASTFAALERETEHVSVAIRELRPL